MLPPEPQSVHKILLFEFSRIGDTLMHEPTLRAIKLHFPHAEIHALTDAANFDLLATHPAIAKAEIFPRKIRKIADLWLIFKNILRLRAEKYDLLINCYLGGLTPLFARYSGIPYRLGFAQNKKLIRTHNLLAKKPSTYSNWIVEFTELVRPLGMNPVDIWPQARFFIPAELEDFASQYLQSDAQYVCYNLGTALAAKCWPPKKYAGIAARLYQDKKWIPVVISNPGQIEYVEAFFQHYPPHLPFVRLPVLRLAEVSTILKRACLLITGDTGLMHLALAIDTPVVAIFTYQRPEYVISPSTRKMIVFREDDETPPMISGQKYGHKDLTQAEVLDAVNALLSLDFTP